MAEIKLIQTESLENDLVVEGEFASEKTMESWGWSKSFILTLALIFFALTWGPSHSQSFERLSVIFFPGYPRQLEATDRSCEGRSTERSQTVDEA